MENTEVLMEFGLTRQEANIYILLTIEGNLSGYEVAKRSGISRSNVYSALAGLVEKGAAYMMEEQAVRYTPVPVKEFCENRIHYMEKGSSYLQKNLPKPKKTTDEYITIKGKRQIDDKIRNMLSETEKRVYFSASMERILCYKEELYNLIQREAKIVLITDKNLQLEGANIYYGSAKHDQIRLITDSQYVLTGNADDEYSSACLFSSNNNLVEVFKDALSNEIKIIEMKRGI